jgi:hypothetical protein
MDKKIAGLLGGVAALTTLGGAQAATEVNSTEALRASSYSDLLTPIANASAALKADDAARQQEVKGTEVAQVVIVGHHHHHHHHHWRRHHRHHHHHHHHSMYFAIPRGNG